MADFTDFAENKIVDLIMSGTDWNPVCHIGLFTAAPNEAGGGTEVTGGSYARVAVATKFAAAAGGTTDNDADILFAEATADWGTVTHVGIFDAPTAGNLLMFKALSASKIVNTGDQFKLGAGNLDVSVD